MKTIPPLPILVVACASFLAACEEKKAPAPSPQKSGGSATGSGDHHDAGAVIELGSATVGAFQVKTTRDEGKIVPGKDAPIDVIVDPLAGRGEKVAAVRFWIGAQDAKGSVKAKAEIENPKEPNHWHTHAEVPDPLPAGSMLWVEIEDDKGTKATASFGLKM